VSDHIAHAFGMQFTGNFGEGVSLREPDARLYAFQHIWKNASHAQADAARPLTVTTHRQREGQNRLRDFYNQLHIANRPPKKVVSLHFIHEKSRNVSNDGR
jgi:hypothetical protein